MPHPLLRVPRFGPLFATQALGALNDNFFRNALAVLALYQSAEHGPLLVTLALGLFILPYVLFSSLAGQLADREDKARLIRLTRLGGLFLYLLAAVGFAIGSVELLLAVLFGLGVQATFFSPLKFGIMPQHLREEELVAANGLIAASTFVAILLGTILGGALIHLAGGAFIVAALSLIIAALGVAASWYIPPAPPGAPGLRLGWNIPRESLALLRQARAHRGVWLAILGTSWFWGFGATLLTQLQVTAKTVLGGDALVLTLLLAVFTLGVGTGAMLCDRLLKGEISPRYVPFAGLGMSFFLSDFTAAGSAAAGSLPHMADVLASAQGWRMLADLFLVACCGGLYSVPLNAIVQDGAPAESRARIIAANSILNALFMVAGAAVASALTLLGLGALGILAILAAANFLVALWIVRILPREVMRALLRWYFTRLHGVRVQGAENAAAAGPRAVITCNHLSFADGALLAAFLPGQFTFAVNMHTARKWWARPFLGLVDTFEVDPLNPYAAKAMVKAVGEGKRLVIFPEGRITRTGALMKVYEGAGLVADKADAMVLPVRIDGLQFTPLSRMQGKLRLRWFPPLAVTVLPPRRLAVDPALLGRRRRRALGDALYDVLTDAIFRTEKIDRTLFAALTDAARRYGARTEIADDITYQPLTYRRLQLGAVVLGRAIAGFTAPGEKVGVMLPNANGVLVTFFALQSQARVPAMLNYVAGAGAMLSACATAQVRVVLSSRAFVERARLAPTVARMEGTVRFVWLEDLRAGIGLAARLRGLWDLRRADAMPGARVAPDSPAAVLFTSGSEGAPKGVVHSHRSLIANCAQLATVIDFQPTDRVLNAMPVFHSFGLTGGTILAVLCGVRIFFYPSPLHYRIVPEVAYDSDATIVFGTDTFLSGWARFAHPYDFRSIRYAFGGAERVRPETRTLYMERFGVRILEGYGATETAAALAVNTPMYNRTGTVGRLLPGVEHRLDMIPDMPGVGRLWVRGPNIMLGYLRASAPGVLDPPEDGWYDTGDLVSIDDDGFVTIRGRAKRFAKIAGEMVSLTACEALAEEVWPGAHHAVVSRPDARKGEQLLLVTTHAGATVAPLLAHARDRGISEIMVPRAILVRAHIPLLATGKTDYPALTRELDAAAA
jgi:acyl-[acyl-carrier-protein]-phospholipid O-acyltransferase/long-chain-fatty-acid--[acyl-carrier-protein] ligase